MNVTLDPAKWRIDDQPFESGTSDVAVIVGGGFLTFNGTDTAGYWGGAAIATVPTFTASPETNLVFTVERVSEGGFGTASRSAIWITDATREHFVFFGDDRGEGNWRYNRKIGASGDNPTGSGTAIAALDQAPYNDLGDHTIKAVVNGQTVKLYVDDVFGAEVAFPFSTGIVFEIGSYARAVGDLAYSVFANAQVTAEQTVLFTTKAGVSQNTAQLLAGSTSTNIAVKIPANQNATQLFTVRVVTSDPGVALPTGAVGDTLTLTFPAGGPTIQEVPVQALKNGGALLTLENDGGVLIGNSLSVLVPYASAGVLMQDDFSGPTYDTTKWGLNTQGFETGTGDMTVSTTGGQLNISGGLTAQYWGGASLKTVDSYVATKDLHLVFEMDRTSMAYTGTAGRSGVLITTGDRSQYVYFGQDWGETAWEVNVNPGNPTGSGTSIAAFSALDDGNSHHLKLVADGSTVQIYLDGISGGSFAFATTTGIFFEVGAYARAQGDTVQASFDNVVIRTEYPPIQVTPPAIVTAANQAPQTVSVVVSPAMLNAASATVTVTSGDPSIAVPAGAVDGALTLTFPAQGSPTNTFQVTPVGVGTTMFDLTNAEGVAVANGVSVTVTEPLYTLLSDGFEGAGIDSNLWRIDDTPLEVDGSTTNGSYITVSNGMAEAYVVSGGVGDAAGIWWGGLALATKEVFSARPTAPVSFEIDRVGQVGTGAERRTAILITDVSRQNWVMFSDDDLNGGWVVDQSTGTLRQNNTGVAAFADPKYNDLGTHRMKLLADGSTVKVYLDGVFGQEVPFALEHGIVFEFGVYARSNPDSVLGTFDNALVTGPVPEIYNTPTSVTITAGQTTNPVVTVTVPTQIHQTNTAHVVVTSSNPSAAVPAGGTGGALTLTFAPGAPDQQTFEVARVGSGIALFTFSNDQGAVSTNTLEVIAQTANPTVLFSDNFDSGTVSSQWLVNTNFHFEPQYASAGDASVSALYDQLELTLTAISNYWPGVVVTAATNFHASLTDPVIFEMDRVFHSDFGSTGGRSGVFIYDASGSNFIWFGDDSENGVNWGYNRSIGQSGDNPTGSPTAIAAFNDSMYRDFGLHHMKLVADGQTVQFYLDGVFGIELPFPFRTGLQFGIMVAARAAGDSITADFDNVTISGSSAPVEPAVMSVALENGNVVVSWTGDGTLQQAGSLAGPWEDLPTATNPFTVPGASLEQRKFYRIQQ